MKRIWKCVLVIAVFCVLFGGSGHGSTTGVYDLREYWNLQPGNRWRFRGYSYLTNEPYRLRIRVERKTLSFPCIEDDVLVVRFIKNKPGGYWGPGKNENLRWLLVDFTERYRWGGAYLYSVGAMVYERGAFWQNLKYVHRYFSTRRRRFPAYVLGPRFVCDGWEFHKTEKFRYGNAAQTTDLCGFCQIGPGGDLVGWKVDYKLTKVVTPAYSGPAFRVRFYEFLGELDGGHFALREDWYLAKGVGIVRIDTKRFHPVEYGRRGGRIIDDPDFLGDFMDNPQTRSELVDFTD